MSAGGLAARAQQLAERTPPGRDRLIDLVRAVSILVVVLGHWTMAALQRDAAGDLGLRNVLEVSPGLHAATWVLQVMPLFFVAAGFTSALGLRRRRGAALFISTRVQRVLPPTLLLVAVWLPLAWLLPRLGVPADLVAIAASNAAMVLWFLAVYLLLALVAPAQHAVHARWPWLLVAVLPVLALALDRTQGTALAGLGLLNYLVVFTFCAELGELYADGRLTRWPPVVWVAVAISAVGALLLATGPGPYPVSMIGLPGQEVSNMMPPSVCVVLVAVLQLALVMLLRPALTRWLARPVPWLLTAMVNRSIMTIFLWHLTGFVAAAGLLLAAGLPLPTPGSAAWWWNKLVWLAVAAALTATLVVLLGRAERGTARPTSTPAPVWAGGVAAVVGLTMIASAGFAHPVHAGGIALAGMQFAALPGALLVLLGWALTRSWASPAEAA